MKYDAALDVSTSKSAVCVPRRVESAVRRAHDLACGEPSLRGIECAKLYPSARDLDVKYDRNGVTVGRRVAREPDQRGRRAKRWGRKNLNCGVRNSSAVFRRVP